MRIGVFVPDGAERTGRPALYYLAGLTCTEETFAIKAGAQRAAAALGLVLVTCDTSPRAARYAGDDADEDFGLGAGFYVDATVAPWRASYRMDTLRHPRAARRRRGRLPGRCRTRAASSATRWAATARWRWRCATRAATAASRPSRPSSRRRGSPGAARRSPATSVPTRRPGPHTTPARWCGRGRCRFRCSSTRGPRTSSSTCSSSRSCSRRPAPTRARACALRRHAGYDHSYYFIASFVEEHLAHHARALAP